jgi:hypothetical protein
VRVRSFGFFFRASFFKAQSASSRLSFVSRAC